MENGMKMGDPNENFTNPPVAIDLTRQTPTPGVSGLGALGDMGTEGVAFSHIQGAMNLGDMGTEGGAPVASSIPEQPKKIKSVEIVQGAAFNPNAVQSFDPTTIIPREEKKPTVDPTTASLASALDMAIEREKQSITERHKALEAQMYEDFLNKQEDEEDEEEQATKHETDSDSFDDLDSSSDLDPEPTSSQFIKPETVYNVPGETPAPTGSSDTGTDSGKKEEPVRIVRTIGDYNEAEFEKDFDDDEDEDEDPKSKREAQELEQKKYAETVFNGLKNASSQSGFSDSIFNKIDLRQFSIGKTPIKPSQVIVQQEQGAVADWVLYEAGKCISMSAFSGPELIQLDPSNSNRNRSNTLKDIYKIIYNHVVDSKKPPFMKWLMQTSYNDLDHIYFAIYKATFGTNNFLAYNCTNPDCEHIFMKTVGFDEMVRYKDDTVKARVQELLGMDTNNGLIKYSVDLIQASNKFVFGMRSPSLYNAAIENAGLSDTILTKYGDMINVINYIDSVYTIDIANKNLIPIALPEPDEDNPVKSVTKKIKVLYQILRQLNSDEYYKVRQYGLEAERKAMEDISYFLPEAKCPECGQKIAEISEDMTAHNLLFTRHHLGAFASM